MLYARLSGDIFYICDMSYNYLQYLPAERANAVQTAIEKAFPGSIVSDVAVLAGGLSTAPVYKMTIDGQIYVLKLDIPQPHTIAGPSEKVLLAAEAGVAPAVYYRNREEGVSISAFIENKPVRSIFSPTELSVRLGAAVKAIHAIPYTTPGNDLQQTIDMLIAGFRQYNILTGAVPEECLRRYEEIKAIYPWQDAEKVFSHNDLNPSNILCDGQNIWIVDWDTAYLNDRYIDLAGVANFFVHTPEQEAAYLKEYFNGEVDDYKVARFQVMKQVSRIIYSMLMFHLAAQRQPTGYAHDQRMEGIYLKDVGAKLGSGELSLATYDGQFQFAKALMNEAVQQMRGKGFEAAMKIMQESKV